jgi:DNA polymerase-4
MDHPEYRGKPVLVGGSPQSRGVVAAASYEARRYGVHSAMPTVTALRLCPQGLLVPPRFDRYREVSRQVMVIFHQFTGLVEPLSLDEAYLDVTHLVGAGTEPRIIAEKLKRRVRAEVGLDLSVGAGTGKSVAKIASDLRKPNGLVVVPPGEESRFLASLPVGKLSGIGPRSVEQLHRENIQTIGQLAAQPLDWFLRFFGKRAGSIRDRARGEDREPVHPGRATRSVSSECTFPQDQSDPAVLYRELAGLSARVARHLSEKKLRGRTVGVKLRLADFTTFTRQTTLPAPTRSEETIRDTTWKLLTAELAPDRAFRLLGVGVSAFGDAEQLPLPLIET